VEKKQKNKKESRVVLLFTEEEIKILIRKAGAARVPVSILCRQYVLKGVGVIQQSLF
jgi:hypothetical protein